MLSPSSSPIHDNKTRIYLPPQAGVQRIEGDMEVLVKDLQKAVGQKSTFDRVYHSYPFPSFSGSSGSDQGVQFQIHLYPISLRNPSSPSCAVYLVVLGWRNAKHLPKFRIDVS